MPTALSALVSRVLLLQAQPDFFRSIGKIYVVVAVIAVVLLGFFVALYLVERRIKRLEDQMTDHERSPD